MERTAQCRAVQPRWSVLLMRVLRFWTRRATMSACPCARDHGRGKSSADAGAGGHQRRHALAVGNVDEGLGARQHSCSICRPAQARQQQRRCAVLVWDGHAQLDMCMSCLAPRRARRGRAARTQRAWPARSFHTPRAAPSAGAGSPRARSPRPPAAVWTCDGGGGSDGTNSACAGRSYWMASSNAVLPLQSCASSARLPSSEHATCARSMFRVGLNASRAAQPRAGLGRARSGDTYYYYDEVRAIYNFCQRRLGSNKTI